MNTFITTEELDFQEALQEFNDHITGCDVIPTTTKEVRIMHGNYDAVRKQLEGKSYHHPLDATPKFVKVYTNQPEFTWKKLKTPVEDIFTESGYTNNLYANIAEPGDTYVGVYINSKFYNVYNYNSSANKSFTYGIVNLLTMGNRVMLYDAETHRTFRLVSPDRFTIFLKRMLQLSLLTKKYNRVTDPVLNKLNDYRLKHALPFPAASDIDVYPVLLTIQDVLLDIEQARLEHERITSKRRFNAEEVELDDYILPVDYDINVHMQFVKTRDNDYITVQDYTSTSSWYNGKSQSTGNAAKLITTEADMSLQYYSQRWADEHGIERYTGDIEQNLAIHDGIQELIEAIKFTERCEDDFLRHEVRSIVFTHAEDFDLLVDAMYAIENDPHMNLSRLI